MLRVLVLLLVAGADEGRPATPAPGLAPTSEAPAAHPAPPPAAPAPPAEAPPPPSPPPGSGYWPAPPAPTPPPPLAPAFTVLLGGLLGGTDQVERRPNGLFAGELGLLFDSGRLRAGVVTSLGLRRDAGAWSLSALAGRTFRPADARPIELLGELGLLRYWQRDSEGVFRTTSVSGGEATLPFAGLRLLVRIGDEPGHGGLVGLFVHQTLGHARAPYLVTSCSFLSACTTEDREARYGGVALGIAFDATLEMRGRASGGGAPATEPGPSGTSW